MRCAGHGRSGEVHDGRDRRLAANGGRLPAAPVDKNPIAPQAFWDAIARNAAIPGAGADEIQPLASPTVEIAGVPYYHQDGYGPRSYSEVSAAQALGYWDDNGFGNLVDSGSSTSGREDELIFDLMRAMSYLPNAGIYKEWLFLGLLSVRGFPAYGNIVPFDIQFRDKYLVTWLEIKSEIDNRRPFVYSNFQTLLYPFWAHSTTGVGYNQTGAHLLYIHNNYPPDTPFELNWDNILRGNEAMYPIRPNMGAMFNCIRSEGFEGNTALNWKFGENGAASGRWGDSLVRAHNYTPHPPRGPATIPIRRGPPAGCSAHRIRIPRMSTAG